MKVNVTTAGAILADLKDPFEAQAYQKLKNSLMTTMIRQKDKLFQAQESPDGQAWAPLSKLAAAKRADKNAKAQKSSGSAGAKFGNAHQILRDTGALMASMSAKVAPHAIRQTAGDEVVIGSSLKYAALQNYGGTVSAKNGKALRFFGAGGQPVFAKSVTIPARPFIGISAEEETQINKVIGKHVSDAFGGGD